MPVLASVFQRSAVTRARSRFALPCSRLACACSMRRLRLLDGGLGLVDLLIEFRRIDLRQRLAGLHVVADVREAAS